jgi:hypothetical protein
MTVEEALRKITLLRKVSSDKGALPAEKATAYRLEKLLMHRYAIKAKEVPDPSPAPVFRSNWRYFDDLFEEFGLRLSHFGGRGSAEVGNNIIVYIRLGACQWWIEEKSASGWQRTVRDRGIDSLREYLKMHAPRSYSFQRR